MALKEIEKSNSPLMYIGEGRFRESYRVEDKVLKLLKPYSTKSYKLFTARFNTPLYTKCKYGISDFNQFEYSAFLSFKDKIPPDLRDNFVEIFEAGEYKGQSASITGLVCDDTDKPSKPLQKKGPIEDAGFWEKLSEIENLLLEQKIFIMDIFPSNVLVKVSDGKQVPIVFDYKRYGARTYPFQPWFRIPGQLEKSLQRRFERIRKQFKKST